MQREETMSKAKEATTTTRVHAFLEILEEEILSIDEDGDGRISLSEIAGFVERSLKQLQLPWYLRLALSRGLIVKLLEIALNALPVKERDVENAKVADEAVAVGRSTFIAGMYFDEEELATLHTRPAGVDPIDGGVVIHRAPNLLEQEERIHEQRLRNEELLQMLRRQKEDSLGTVETKPAS
jgi:hypothetical protein